jgi:hypothetical protein
MQFNASLALWIAKHWPARLRPTNRTQDVMLWVGGYLMMTIGYLAICFIVSHVVVSLLLVVPYWYGLFELVGVSMYLEMEREASGKLAAMTAELESRVHLDTLGKSAFHGPMQDYHASKQR